MRLIRSFAALCLCMVQVPVLKLLIAEGLLLSSIACSAICALAIDPRVFEPFEPNVAIVAGKALGDGVLAIGVLRTIEAAPRQQAGEMRDPDAEDLPCQDVIDPLLKVRNFGCQSLSKTTGDFAQEDPGLRTRVQEFHCFVGP